MLSEICATFGCLPDEAERQDYVTVTSIIECRNFKQAIKWFNGGDGGASELEKHPELVKLMDEVTQAMEE